MPRQLRHLVAALLLALPAATTLARAAEPLASTDAIADTRRLENDKYRHAPIDYGPGAGVVPARMRTAASLPGILSGGPTAAIQGAFGPAVAWPLIPLHMVLLPDGRVMNYGTDQNGVQGGQFIYDVWNPALGTGSDAHLVLPNTTATDIFCSTQSVLWETGQVLITGGDLTVNGTRNFSQNKTTLFSPQSNTIKSLAPMQYPRWYSSLIALPDGEMLVLGGRSSPSTPVFTPEVFNTDTGWRSLTGATSAPAFSGNYGWFYPRAFVNSHGHVFVLKIDGTMFSFNTSGEGHVRQYNETVPLGDYNLPTVMFAPDRLLSLRDGTKAVVIEIGAATPTVTPTSPIDQNRFWSSGTVMADGQVLVTGGSLAENALTGVAYAAQIWNPATGLWTVGASATKPRLYHSNALLLPDATVLTAGGGAPGPVNNLNAEIYYPPYLYKRNGSGQLAPRPSLAGVPAVANVGDHVTGMVGADQRISEVTFVRTGSATHSTNLDQRFLRVPFTQSGNQITATLPGNPNILLPGYYMMFVFNAAHVPSVASMVLVRGS